MELAPDVFVSTLRYGALGADMSVWLATRGRRTVLRFLIETYTREGEYVGFERDIPVRVIKTAGPALSPNHPQNVPLARVFLPRLASLQMLVKTLGELQRSLDIGANSLGTVAVRAGEEKRDIQTWDRLSAPSSKSPRAARRERQAPAPELDSDEEVEALTRSHPRRRSDPGQRCATADPAALRYVTVSSRTLQRLLSHFDGERTAVLTVCTDLCLLIDIHSALYAESAGTTTVRDPCSSFPLPVRSLTCPTLQLHLPSVAPICIS